MVWAGRGISSGQLDKGLGGGGGGYQFSVRGEGKDRGTCKLGGAGGKGKIHTIVLGELNVSRVAHRKWTKQVEKDRNQKTLLGTVYGKTSEPLAHGRFVVDLIEKVKRSPDEGVKKVGRKTTRVVSVGWDTDKNTKTEKK